jgi:hypothetical protein
MRHRLGFWRLGLASLVMCGGCALDAAPPSAVTFAVSGRTNSTPWIAAADSFVAVVWGASAEGKADVMLAVSRDAGRTFSASVRVNAVAGDARLSGEIPPRVTLAPRSAGGDPSVTVVWNAKDRGTEIKSATSRDGGRTFSAAISLQRPDAAGDRGWQAATLDARGNLHTIWLDHRGLATDIAKPSSAGHKGEHDGVAMAQKSGLYYRSVASSSERELFKGVCYCCKTAIATGAKGEIYAAWRHVFPGNLRDMALTVSRDGGRSFDPLVRVHEDKWSINGCPDDGPAMAVAPSGSIHLVWPTVLDGTVGALHYSWTHDGRSFISPVRVPTLGSPKPSHPQIAIDARGRVMVAWDEVVKGVRTAVAREVRQSGGGIQFGPTITLDESGSAMYPVLAAIKNGWMAVWTGGGTPSTVRGRVLAE